MINIKPSLKMKFEQAGTHQRWLWDNTSNCYGYGINHENLDGINLGSLTLNCDRGADIVKLTSSDGLQELLDRDGWISVDKDIINPNEMHVIGVFGFYPLGRDFNDFHVLRLNCDGSFSEKVGNGLPIRNGAYNDHVSSLTIDNLENEYTKDIAKSVMPPVFSGFWKMPDEGLSVHPRHFRRGSSELIPYPAYR